MDVVVGFGTEQVWKGAGWDGGEWEDDVSFVGWYEGRSSLGDIAQTWKEDLADSLSSEVSPMILAIRSMRDRV